MIDKHGKEKYKFIMFVSLICLVLLLVYAIGAGQFHISFDEVCRVLIGIDSPVHNVNVVVRRVRLPRVLFSCIAGAGLAVAGAGYQALFANPLASPDTLGTANGASFGAALAILLGLHAFGVQMMAMLMGVLSILLVFMIARPKRNYTSSLMMVILSGIVISSLFSALVTGVKYVADPNDVLPVITFWLMGSFSSITLKSLTVAVPCVLTGTVLLYLLRFRLNVLSLSEEEALALGINLKVTRILVIFASSLITATIVSVCGVIGWVGLLIPHIARMIFGNNNVRIIPASIIFGAIFMLLTDTIARTLTQAEIPVSILTAIIGAPVFILILRRTGGIQR